MLHSQVQSGFIMPMAFLLAIVGAGCNGLIGKPPTSDQSFEIPGPGNQNRALVCDPTLSPSAAPMMRLSRTQYDNAIRTLFAGISGVVEIAAPHIAALPYDTAPGQSYGHMDNRVTDRHVEAYFATAEAIASGIADDPVLLSSLAGPCANADPIDAMCFQTFIQDFAPRAKRRDLTANELNDLLAINETGLEPSEVYPSALLVLLMSPEFLFVMEYQGGPVQTDPLQIKLTPFELASRLSLTLQNAPPDELLLSAARSEELSTEAGYQAQVDRLLADSSTQAAMDQFYLEWFRIPDNVWFQPHQPLGPNHHGGRPGGLSSDRSLHRLHRMGYKRGGICSKWWLRHRRRSL